MGTDIGGINISFGIDLGNVENGAAKIDSILKGIKSNFTNFQNSIKNISLDSVIKGNPFSDQEKYIKSSMSSLDGMYKLWRKEINATENNLGGLAAKSKKGVDELNKKLQVLMEKYKAVQSVSERSGFALAQKYAVSDKPRYKSIGDGYTYKGLMTKKTDTQRNANDLQKELEELQKAFPKLEIVNEILHKIKNNVEVTQGEILKDFDKLAEGLAKEEAAIKPKLEEMANDFKKLYASQEDALYKERLKSAGDTDKFLDQRNKKTKEAVITEKELKTQIAAGINVQENRNKLLQHYINLEKEGIKVSQSSKSKIESDIYKDKMRSAGDTDKFLAERNKRTKEAAIAEKELRTQIAAGINVQENRNKLLQHYINLEKEGKKLSGSQQMSKGKVERDIYKDQLKAAGDVTLALQRKNKAVQQSAIEERRLITEIKAGINVNRNRIALLQIQINKFLALPRLTKSQARELKKLRLEQDKLNASSAHTKNGFMSATWMKQRAAWFIQLRGYWAIYRGLADAVSGMIDFENQLARALRTAQSAIMDQAEIVKRYSKAMSEMPKKTGASWEQVGETLYQLGSAGLSAEESLGALNGTLSLLIGTEGDARETTKAVAGIYNNYGESLTNLSTKQEKFQYIIDLMAQTWKNYQVEISEYTDGMKMASTMANIAGISLQQLDAVLAVSNQHMIKAGRAGRSFQNVLARLSQQPFQFKKIFNLDDTIFDPSMDVGSQFNRIFGELHKRMKDGTLSALELGDAFKTMGLRGAPEFAVIVKYFDEIIEKIEMSGDVAGTALDIQDKKLDTVSGKWEIFKGVFKTFSDDVLFLNDLMKLLLDRMTRGLSEIIAKFKVLSENRDDLKAAAVWVSDVLKYLDPTNMPGSEKRKNEEKEAIVRREKEIAQNKILYELKNKMRKEDFGKTSDFGEIRRSLKYQNVTEEQYNLIKGSLRNEELTNFRKDLTEVIKNDGVDAGKEFSRLFWLGFKEATGKEQELIKPKPYKEGALDLELKALRERTSLSKKLLAIDNRIVDKRKEIKGMDDAIENIKNDPALATQDEVRGQRVRALQNQQLLNEKELQQMLDERANVYSTIVKEGIKIHELNKNEIDSTIKGLEHRKKMLEFRGLEKDEGIEVKQIILDQYEEEKKKAWETYQINLKNAGLAKERVEDLKKAAGNVYQRDLDEAKMKMLMDEEERVNRVISQQKKEISLETQKAVNLKNIELAQAEIEQKDQGTILKLQGDLVELRRQELIAVKEVYETAGKTGTVEHLQVVIDIRKQEAEILKIAEKKARFASITYDFYQGMREELVTFHDVMVDSMKQFANGMADGFGEMWFQLTTGFQEAQQEVKNIEGQIAELGQEKDELTASGTKQIFTEEEAKRLVEINQEMSKLKGQVDDLENPIKNLGKIFKDFFKSLIDDINKAISRWLAMQLVMRVVGMFSGPSVGLGSVPVTSSLGGMDLAGGYDFSNVAASMSSRATGGILPKINSFRKFSKGGLTSGLSMAVLGDNRSGTELVIPSENINSDSVSGYTRNSGGDIYIANVLSEKDLQGLMSTPDSGKIIVNHVLSNIDSRGAVFKQLGGR